MNNTLRQDLIDNLFDAIIISIRIGDEVASYYYGRMMMRAIRLMVPE